MKNKDNFFRYALYACIVWVLYSLIVASVGGCSLFMKKGNDGWYIYYEQGETNESGNSEYHDVYYDGPITKSEAIEIIKDCENEGKEFLNKYGTIYSILPDNSFSPIYYAIICFGPFLLLFIYYRMKKK